MLVNVLGIPGLLLVIYLGDIIFAGFVTFVMLYALFEFYGINIQAEKANPETWVGWVAALGLGYVYYVHPELEFIATVLIVIGAILAATIYELFRNKEHPTNNVSVTIFGILYIPVLLGTMIWIRQYDSDFSTHLTFGLFISIWICDSAAYAFGMKWGKKKIMPRVSPKKSVVGTVAGVLGAFVAWTIMVKSGFTGGHFGWSDIIILTIITGGFGQLGDFFESLLNGMLK